MLTITIPDTESIELWDERNECFIESPSIKGQTIGLEHSLVSLSKWESKWCKAFFSKKEKTHDEIIDYIKCMTLTEDVRPEIYNNLSDENMRQIDEYINAKMTATVIPKTTSKGSSRETVTTELIYYWMITLNIPVEECQHWHINRLLSLIGTCNFKNTPPKKMSKSELMRRNAALNAQRRQQLNTKG